MMAGNLVQILFNSVKTGGARLARLRRLILLAVVALIGNAATVFGQAREAAATHQPGGEANLKLPDLSQVKFMGVDGHTLLLFGLVVCVLGRSVTGSPLSDVDFVLQQILGSAA